jgi:carboxypeptidase Q
MKMKNLNIVILFLLLLFKTGFSQVNDSLLISNIFDEALSSRIAYGNLRYLCKNMKGRVTGSPQAAAAVEFTKQIMENMDLDSVYLQEVLVPNWNPGDKEFATITSSLFGSKEVSVCALGNSIGTGANGMVGEIVEVKNFEELAQIGREKIEGKIVFYNRPMETSLINTFAAYGGAVNQRTSGAAEAAKYGAIGAVVRSVTTALDDFPHTGVMRYQEGIKKIPAVAISTNDADVLGKWLKKGAPLTFYFRTTCKQLKEVTSFNVIGQIKGTKYPEEIIVVGGHLDAWFNSEGAHDDGAGCIQSIEVLRLFKKLGIKPKRTIRAVMFMDEEVAQRGGQKYAEIVGLKNEKHYFALESDRGALTPRGFSFSVNQERFQNLSKFKKFFEPYLISSFTIGGGGVDIGPLRKYNVPLASIVPDVQRYFDYHHSENDTFEQINIRELQLGSAAIASLIYLIDKYGF